MKKALYTAPRFDFEELFLFEGVAGTCWGYGHVYIRIYRDLDHSNNYDASIDEELWYNEFSYDGNPNTSGHCHDVAKQVEAFVQQSYGTLPEEYIQYIHSVAAGENSQSLVDVPIQDFIVS